MSQPTALQSLSAAVEAERESNWVLATSLYSTHRTLAPDQEAGWLGGARPPGEERRVDGLDALRTEAPARSPSSLAVALARAAAAPQQARGDEAVRPWKA